MIRGVISTLISLPDPPSLPWGEGVTPEAVLSVARMRCLAALRGLVQGVRGVETRWIPGPQGSPNLQVLARYEVDEGDVSEVVAFLDPISSALLHETMATAFRVALHYAGDAHRRSLGRSDPFTEAVSASK